MTSDEKRYLRAKARADKTVEKIFAFILSARFDAAAFEWVQIYVESAICKRDSVRLENSAAENGRAIREIRQHLKKIKEMAA